MGIGLTRQKPSWRIPKSSSPPAESSTKMKTRSRRKRRFFAKITQVSKTIVAHIEASAILKKQIPWVYCLPEYGEANFVAPDCKPQRHWW